MRKGLFTFLFLSLLALFLSTGCTEKKTDGVDSLNTDTLVTDSVDSISNVVESNPMPVAADELFDDFFFNFAGSKKVQLKRVAFPIKVTEFGKSSIIEKKNWRVEHFFMGQGYYTLIFDTKKQLNVMKDTTVNDVTVEKISMSKGVVKQWHFVRNRGLWMLNDINTVLLKQHQDASFLTFYQRFVTDPKFQQNSLSESVTFTGPDPEDDFSTMTGEILPEQWPVFAPWLPSGSIYNIVYGKPQQTSSSNVRYFLLRGISNGLQTDLMFVRKGGAWKLKTITT